MSPPYRILLTCRDPGAATQMVALAAALNRSENCDAVLLASGAGADLAQAGGRCLDVLEVSAPSAAALVADAGAAAKVDRHLAEWKPHILIAGLSTGDFGLDELALKLALRRGDILTAQYLDFWGEYQVLPGYHAHYVFLMDEAGREFLRVPRSTRVEVVGSPKHEAYVDLDWNRLRRNAQDKWSIGKGRMVLGYFAQTERHIPGHDRGFREWLAALEARPEARDRCLILCKPHPKYPETAAGLGAALERCGIPGRLLDPQVPPELVLSACHSVFSSFSTVNIDFTHACRHRRRPGGSVFLENEETRQHLEGKLGSGYREKIERAGAYRFWDSGVMAQRVGTLLGNSPGEAAEAMAADPGGPAPPADRIQTILMEALRRRGP